jgi:hypothetical protein
MTLTDFLQHWSLTENPFRGEEARSDPVFNRMSGANSAPSAVRAGENGQMPIEMGTFHSDFEKIIGDLRRPASSVVFGEKGSGKTAIRLQIARRIGDHNAANPGAKVLLAPYDDLNGVLDRLHERLGGKTPLESLQKTRLVDHLDAVAHVIVPRLVDAVLETGGTGAGFIDLPEEPKRLLRRLDTTVREDLLVLQTLYDRPDGAPQRTRSLRRRLRIKTPVGAMVAGAIVVLVPPAILAVLVWSRFFAPKTVNAEWVAWGLAGAAAIYALFALKVILWDRLRLVRLGRKVRRQIRVIARRHTSYAQSLAQLTEQLRDTAQLPISDSDDPRYAAIERLRRVLRALGYAGIVVVVDRVDEPTLISGDPDRMKAVIWPMLNNKFLQQEGIGFKLLLPMELRHAVFRESSAFFQEARLDKQHFVEHLAWTGPMLFDLCNSRMAACTFAGAPPVTLPDLFAADVTRQDLIDALDRLHQPRDAFKLMYRCLMEHCAGVTAGQNEWKVPRHILTSVLKSESDRVQQMYRGIRPA